MKFVHTDNAPAAIGPYSQGIRAGNLVFTSGQIPLDPATGLIPQGIEAQTRQAMENVLAVLAQAGATAENIVKTTVFLRNMDDFAAMNGVYATFFSGPAPARSAVQVARLPKDCPLEIEAVAVL